MFNIWFLERSATSKVHFSKYHPIRELKILMIKWRYKIMLQKISNYGILPLDSRSILDKFINSDDATTKCFEVKTTLILYFSIEDNLSNKTDKNVSNSKQLVKLSSSLFC